MKRIRVIIIGGGASGMMAAIAASRQGADVTILEEILELARRYWLQEMDDVTYKYQYRC